MANNKNIRCSFCGKSQENVHRIVAGPGVYIGVCVQVLTGVAVQVGVSGKGVFGVLVGVRVGVGVGVDVAAIMFSCELALAE